MKHALGTTLIVLAIISTAISARAWSDLGQAVSPLPTPPASPEPDLVIGVYFQYNLYERPTELAPSYKARVIVQNEDLSYWSIDWTNSKSEVEFYNLPDGTYQIEACLQSGNCSQQEMNRLAEYPRYVIVVVEPYRTWLPMVSR